MAWLVRDAVLTDLDPVVRIDQASQSTPWPREALRDCIQGNGDTVMLVICPARWPGAPAGFAAGRFLPDEFEVLNLAVMPDKRNRGLGRLLMEGLRDKARGAGRDTWILEVRDSNQAARHLYRSLGLVETGRRLGYYADTGEPAILMAGPVEWIMNESQK